MLGQRRLKKIKVLATFGLLTLILLYVLWTVWIERLVPAAWLNTDTGHLYQVVTDFQDFDVDNPLTEYGDLSDQMKPNLSLYEELILERQAVFQQYHDLVKRFQPSNDLQDATFQLIQQFQPILEPVEAARLVFTLDTFVRACSQRNLVYFMTEASLMGVLRHHGLIPWDDDIDIAMSSRQWREIRDALGNIEGFQLYAPRASQWKFFMSSASSFPDKPFKFPYLDIFFYAEDETHAWAITKGLKHDLIYKKTDVFPLRFRPFEHLLVPVPCNLDLLVRSSHDIDLCVTPEYIHKTNRNVRLREQTSVSCSLLHGVYPFVWVSKSARAGYVDEYLMLGDAVLHKVSVVDGCSVCT
nr:fukutin-related protein-like [Biomphalaria glabrata]